MRTFTTIAAIIVVSGLTVGATGTVANATDSDTVTIGDHADAATAEAGVPASMPDFLQLYDGAERVSLGPNDDPQRSGATLVFTTRDTVGDVIDFYRTSCEVIGDLHLNIDEETGNGRAYVASNRQWQVVVDAERNGGDTEVTLTWYHTDK